MDPLAALDDSSTDDETASQTTEDDPQVPEHPPNQAPPPAPIPLPTHAPLPSTSATNPQRDRPHYQPLHTLRGHTKSISAVKFSPDGKLLASCGVCVMNIWRLADTDLILFSR